MVKVRELDGEMRVALPVEVSLVGGSILVEVAGVTSGKRLAAMVTELIESREGRFGIVGPKDIDALDQVRHELTLASDLLANRVSLERDRRRARGEAL